jgi:hypothetical protein
MSIVMGIFLFVHLLLADRARLAAENLSLRQQVAILKRTNPGPRLRQQDRIFWVWLARFWREWRSALVLVKPETVVRWHREGFRLYWRWKSRAGRVGRPRIEAEVRGLIRRLARENPLWGAPRIASELRLHVLGARLSRLDPGLSRRHRRALARSRAAVPRPGAARGRGRPVMSAPATVALAELIQAFFRRHLIGTRGVSPHTLHAYRDAICGLLTFAAARRDRAVVDLSLDDLGRDTVLAFLEHLEQQRGNAVVTRNARLAALHSLYRFVAAEDPAALAVCQGVLAIPYKRPPSRPVTCLARADVEHLLSAIGRDREIVASYSSLC